MAKQKDLKSWLQPVLVILLIVSAFAIGSMWTQIRMLKSGQGSKATASPQTQQEPAAPKITLNQVKSLFGQDLIKFGDANKKVLFVEISDPSCPYCAAAAGKNPELNRQIDLSNNRFKLTTDGGKYVAPVPEMRKLIDSGKAGFVFLYSPGHGNGEVAMKALYCANEQGKFWQAHDILMSNKGYNLINNTVKNDMTQAQKVIDLVSPAVNAAQLKACLDSAKYDGRITSDPETAKSLLGNSMGTPSFVVNTQSVLGAQPYDTAIKPLVDAALK
jgi:protein-disulfide isomerase